MCKIIRVASLLSKPTTQSPNHFAFLGKSHPPLALCPWGSVQQLQWLQSEKNMSHQIVPSWQKDMLSAFRWMSKCSFYHPTTFEGAVGAYALHALIWGSMLWSAVRTGWHLLTADGKTAVVFTLSCHSVTHQTCFCLSLEKLKLIVDISLTLYLSV